jgi:hypothetical protein
MPLAMALVVVSGWLGCGGTQEGVEAPKPPTTAKADDDTPAGSVDRRLLDAILREGPPWLLERVPIEEVMDQGKFKGWRLQDFPAEWSHVELQPGDVVTALNGMALETPDQLWAAWANMGTSNDIKVTFVREGEAKELRVPIWGKPDPALAAQLGSSKPPMPPAGAGSGAPPAPSAGPAELPPGPPKDKPGKKLPGIKDTIIIHGDEKPASESSGDW